MSQNKLNENPKPKKKTERERRKGNKNINSGQAVRDFGLYYFLVSLVVFYMTLGKVLNRSDSPYLKI